MSDVAALVAGGLGWPLRADDCRRPSGAGPCTDGHPSRCEAVASVGADPGTDPAPGSDPDLAADDPAPDCRI